MALNESPDRSELEWLAARSKGYTWTGYDASGWEDSVWILHAMYENPHLPDDLTYHQAMQGPANAELLDVYRDGSHAPRPGWERLRWQTLAERQELRLFDNRKPPGHTTFLYWRWPLSIRCPDEGCLDWEQLLLLTTHLAEFTGRALFGHCYAYFSALSLGEPVLYEGNLKDVLDSYEQAPFNSSPNTFWDADRRWIVWTDYDLWATRVSGPTELIDGLVSDEDLETARMDPLFDGSFAERPVRVVTKDSLMRLKDPDE